MSFNYNELFAPVPPEETILPESYDMDELIFDHLLEEEEFRRRVEEIAEEMERY